MQWRFGIFHSPVPQCPQSPSPVSTPQCPPTVSPVSTPQCPQSPLPSVPSLHSPVSPVSTPQCPQSPLSSVPRHTGEWRLQLGTKSLGTLGSGDWGHWGVETGDTGEWRLGTLHSKTESMYIIPKVCSL